MGGFGSLVNSVLGGSSSARTQNRYNKAAQEREFKFNKELAAINQKYALQSMAKQFGYEKEAALNAHQWEISDLEKAGLNPILSMGGNGASADVGLTSGSAGSVGMAAGANPQVGSIMDMLSGAMTLAKSAKEIGLIKQQTEQLGEDTKLTAEKVETEKTQQRKNKADAKYADERARGFSESSSESHTSSKDNGWGFDVGGNGKIGQKFGGGVNAGGKIGANKKKGKSESHTKSHSRTW